MDDRLFRDAMGKFATGVTVISTKVDEKVHGMTANAFMSVSLNPKLVTISVATHAKMHSLLKQSGKYAVNFLTEDQKPLSMLFAGQMKDEPFEVDFDELGGTPVIPDSLAVVACDIVEAYDVGDHTLFVGAVTDIQVNEGEPLLFHAGKYSRKHEFA